MGQVPEENNPWLPSQNYLPLNDDPHYFRVNLDFNDGSGDLAYKKAHFYSSQRPRVWLNDAYIVNESLAALVSLVFNALVLLVFIRVLGFKRLPSQLITSLAVSHCFFTIIQLSHSYVSEMNLNKDVSNACNFTYVLSISSWFLTWTCLSCAVAERILAMNMPLYYSATLPLNGAVLTAAPWTYGLVLVGLSELGIFDYGMTYGCSKHLVHTPMDSAKMVVQITSYTVLILFLVILIMSRILHPVYADDAWETNRIKMEMKTTIIIIQVAALNVILWCPFVTAETVVYYSNSHTFYQRRIVQLCYQLAIHSNYVLFLVLLCRQEFRKALTLLLANKETIRKTRQTNLLVEAVETSRRRRSQGTLESESMIRLGAVDLIAREEILMMDPPEFLRDKVIDRISLSWPLKMTSISN